MGIPLPQASDEVRGGTWCPSIIGLLEQVYGIGVSPDEAIRQILTYPEAINQYSYGHVLDVRREVFRLRSSEDEGFKAAVSEVWEGLNWFAVAISRNDKLSSLADICPGETQLEQLRCRFQGYTSPEEIAENLRKANAHLITGLQILRGFGSDC